MSDAEHTLLQKFLPGKSTQNVPSLSPFPLGVPMQITEIVDRLRSEGYRAFLVGGALRNALLGLKIHDWDMATDAPCDRIRSMFERVLPTGIAHGTVTVIYRNQAIEVTSFGSRGLLWDLGRRDFTINAMAYEPLSAKLIDPHGGRGDLHDRRVRAVADPRARFLEDPIRILRAIRIAVELGFSMSQEIWSIIPQFAQTLRQVAVERVRTELMRIMLAVHCDQGFRWMKRTGVMEVLLPELVKPNPRMKKDIWCLKHALRVIKILPAESHLRWAGLLHDHETRDAPKRGMNRNGTQKDGLPPARKILEHYRFSRKEIREIIWLIEHYHVCRTSDPSDGMIRRYLLHFGPDRLRNLKDLCRACVLASESMSPQPKEMEGFEERVRRVLIEYEKHARLAPALDGNAVMRILDISSGPRVGEILRDLEYVVTENPSVNTHEDLTRWLLSRHAKRGCASDTEHR